MSAPGDQPGSSCHQCKTRRDMKVLHQCTNPHGAGNKPCRKKFCNHCLGKFYNVTIRPNPNNEATWTCPWCLDVCVCAACNNKKAKLAEKGGLKVKKHNKKHGLVAEAVDVSPLNIVPGQPVEGGVPMLDEMARSLLLEVSRDRYVQSQMSRFTNMRDLNEQQKVAALTSLLNHSAFPSTLFPDMNPSPPQ